MQTSFDRLNVPLFSPKRSQTLLLPMSDEQTRVVRDDATQFAERLLDNYKQHLSRSQPRAD